MFAFKNRRLMLILSLLVLMTTGTANFQAAHADTTSWSSILKPLFNEVIMPGIDKSIDTMQARIDARNAKKNQSQVTTQVTSTDSYSTTSTSSSTSSEDIYGAGDTSTSTSTPQEPTSTDVPSPVANP